MAKHSSRKGLALGVDTNLACSLRGAGVRKTKKGVQFAIADLIKTVDSVFSGTPWNRLWDLDEKTARRMLFDSTRGKDFSQVYPQASPQLSTR
jgi:hypothetical protein